jgi:mono/diheme cytochrome c family protein
MLTCSPRTSLLGLAIAAACVATPAALAAPKTIELPPDGMQLTASSLPGYAKAQAICISCHSAEYLRYQPATAPRSYWEAMVQRMKTVFKAPVPDEDVAPIVEYLARTYGNEQPK